MPYVRITSGRKAPTKSKVSKGKYVRSGYQVAKTPTSAMAVTRYLERKYFNRADYTLALTQVAPTILDLTSINSGAGAQARVGNRITPISLDFNCQTVVDPTIRTDIVRVILFQWREDANVIIPNATDILNDVAPSQPVISQYNVSKSKSYKILSDFTLSLDVNANALLSTRVSVHQTSMNHITFDDAAAFGHNAIYMMAMCVNGTAGNPTGFNFTSQLRFTDA